MRVVIYVQHLQGSGHLVRMTLLAEALSSAGHEVMLVSGGIDYAATTVRRQAAYEFIQLPALKGKGLGFSELVDEHEQAVDEAWQQQRRDLLIQHVLEYQADVVVIETYPFGRRQFRHELEPLLLALRSTTTVHGTRPLLLSSIRDILQPPKAKRVDWLLTQLTQYFDGVLVHGDGRLIDLVASFSRAKEIPIAVAYVGYIAAKPNFADNIDAQEAGRIVVSAGGGAVAAPLLMAAAAASKGQDLQSQGVIWHLMAGRRLAAADYQHLQRDQHGAMVLQRNRPREDFLGLLAQARVSVSQIGYNTAIDLLQCRVPAVLVPFSAAGELEQSIRAQLLAKAGLAVVLPEAELTHQQLLAAVNQAIKLPVTSVDWQMDQGAAAVQQIVQWHEQASSGAAALTT